MAGWQNGYAADCKSVDLGSTPGLASIFARVVELVDTRDLKSLAGNSVPVQVRPRAPFPYYKIRIASIAQLVERNLAKVEVTSSNLVTRSNILCNGGLAEWLCSGLQIRGPRFDSGTRLHKNILPGWWNW